MFKPSHVHGNHDIVTLSTINFLTGPGFSSRLDLGFIFNQHHLGILLSPRPGIHTQPALRELPGIPPSLPSPPPVYISFFHPSRRLCPVVVLAVATTVPSRCICKIFIVCSSRAFNILEILANKHRQSSLLFKDQLPSSSSSPTLEGKNKRNDKMAAGGSGSRQPQFLVRAGDENFSHAPLIENPETDQIIVPDSRLIYNLVHSTSMGYVAGPLDIVS
ncbi:metal transporter Nramp1-like [Cucumis melo var. makuwa]|uniref:Metal transporter Nramp1-like n=1 Tax=Cucumis melo var. makuwa TaxID=1194695 RepID=A0A5A7URA9_CUCMM|nr:metal transporter Nramp1-like [Cucumis melo var. makuwa]TYK19536.1 metal transporter Nramp1-like [Cucumis melo var. makuwa]